MRGAHLIKHWAATQKVVALSSGEAELGGIVKGISEAIGLRSLGADLGEGGAQLVVHADASAAIGICRRTGIGKVRHLAVGQLWVQEKVRQGEVQLMKILGANNPADMLTKPRSQSGILRHMTKIGLQLQGGRASSAPDIK